jgi:hypothetical protein
MKRLLIATILPLSATLAGVYVARPAPAAQTGGDHYALLIGVNKYDDVRAINRNANLAFAERDSEQIAEALLGRGFPPDKVLIMSTAAARGGELYPTAANVRRQVKGL